MSRLTDQLIVYLVNNDTNYNEQIEKKDKKLPTTGLEPATLRLRV